MLILSVCARVGRISTGRPAQQDRVSCVVLRQEDRRLSCAMALVAGGQQACLSPGRACPLL